MFLVLAMFLVETRLLLFKVEESEKVLTVRLVKPGMEAEEFRADQSFVQPIDNTDCVVGFEVSGTLFQVLNLSKLHSHGGCTLCLLMKVMICVG